MFSIIFNIFLYFLVQYESDIIYFDVAVFGVSSLVEFVIAFRYR